MPVEWSNAMAANQRVWDQTESRLNTMAQHLREERRRQEIGQAIDGLNGPDRQNALSRLYSLKPEIALQMEDQLFQRDERQRADDFRQGAAGMILNGPRNHALGGNAAAMMGSDAPSSNSLALPPPRPGPNSGRVLADGDGPSNASSGNGGDRLRALEPHRDKITKAAEIVRRLNPTDDASWQQALSEAERAGVDISGAPRKYVPQYVQGLVSLADHFGGQAETAPPQSSDYERAARADPEKFLTFQGKQTQITKDRFEIARAINGQAMQLLGGVHDQASYDASKLQARQLYESYGEDFSPVEQTLPAEYSPELIRDLQLRGMDTAKQLAAVARENRLEHDIADDEADNQRADRNTSSLIRTRGERLRQSGKPKPQRTAAPKAPTPSTVAGRLMDKESRGEAMTPAEQRTLDAYRVRGRGRGSVSSSEPVAVGPNGERLVVRNGKWVPAK